MEAVAVLCSDLGQPVSIWLLANCSLPQQDWDPCTYHQSVKSFLSTTPLHVHCSPALQQLSTEISRVTSHHHHCTHASTRLTDLLTQWVPSQGEGSTAYLLLATSGFLEVSVAFNLCFRFKVTGNPLSSFVSSSCCYIPACEQHLSARHFLCCLVL